MSGIATMTAWLTESDYGSDDGDAEVGTRMSAMLRLLDLALL
jgi:hypothetical protein